MKYFTILFNAFSDTHSIIAGGASLVMLFAAVCLLPIPMTTGNVTAARWVYNYQQDIKATITTNRVASISRDRGASSEMRIGFSLTSMQLRLMALQNDRVHTENSTIYTVDERERKVRDINEKLNRLYRDMERKGIKWDDIQSQNDLLMIAGRR